jgi:hypothetical protein
MYMDGRAGSLPGRARLAGEPGATGMVMVQIGVSAAEAFAMLRAYSYARDRRLRMRPGPAGRAPQGPEGGHE